MKSQIPREILLNYVTLDVMFGIHYTAKNSEPTVELDWTI